MPPGCFAMVMATGIISIGMNLIGIEALSLAVLVVCAEAYLVFVVLTAWRVMAFRSAFSDDLRRRWSQSRRSALSPMRGAASALSKRLT
ncbi:hypothetical protein [Cryobacterium glaciale]